MRVQREDRPRVLLIVGLSAIVIGRAAMAMIRMAFTDDAFFYAVLARNLAAGRGWTFDGVTTTNGVHPLLLALETAVAWGMGPGTSPCHFYRALVVLLAVVFLAGFAALARWTRPSGPDGDRSFGLAVWLALGVLLLPAYQSVVSVGMESSLALPLAAVCFVLWYRGRNLAAGLAGGALALARLDAIECFVLPLAVVRFVSGLAARERWPLALWRGFVVVAPGAVLLAGYAGWNLYAFGEPAPMNAALKSSFPIPNPQWFQLLGPPGDLASRLAFLHAHGHYYFLAAAALLAMRPRPGGPTREAIVALLLVYLTTQANFALFQKWSKPTPNWYLWPSLLAALLALFLGAGRVLPERILRRAAVALGLLLVLLGARDVAHLGAHAVRHRGEPPDFWRSPLVDYLRSQPVDQLWAATDCGRAAFWGERRFVDVDGLMSGWQLQSRIATGGLGAYLKELGVTRVVVYAWDRAQTTNREYEPMYRSYVNPAAFRGEYEVFPFQVYSYRFGAYSEVLPLRREQEAWRSPAYRDGLGMARTLAFDLTRGEPGP